MYPQGTLPSVQCQEWEVMSSDPARPCSFCCLGCYNFYQSMQTKILCIQKISQYTELHTCNFFLKKTHSFYMIQSLKLGEFYFFQAGIDQQCLLGKNASQKIRTENSTVNSKEERKNWIRFCNATKSGEQFRWLLGTDNTPSVRSPWQRSPDLNSNRVG